MSYTTEAFATAMGLWKSEAVGLFHTGPWPYLHINWGNISIFVTGTLSHTGSSYWGRVEELFNEAAVILMEGIRLDLYKNILLLDRFCPFMKH